MASTRNSGIMLQGFDEDFYVNRKLLSLQSDPNTSKEWENKGPDDVKALMTREVEKFFDDPKDATPEAHYQFEGCKYDYLAPNAYFSNEAYKESWEKAYPGQSFVEAHRNSAGNPQSPYFYYLQHSDELSIDVNPAGEGSFDTEDCIRQLLVSLDNFKYYDSVEEARPYIKSIGYTPLTYWLAKGDKGKAIYNPEMTWPDSGLESGDTNPPPDDSDDSLVTVNESAISQYALELINYARLYPDETAEKYGIDLNEGLPAGTISSASKAPLAMNTSLVNAAKGHSVWMLETGIFDHTGEAGSQPWDRTAAAGYDGSYVGENIAAYWGMMPEDVRFPIDQHLGGLFHSEGHRENTMRENFVEVGIGHITGPDQQYGEQSYLTENFGSSSSVYKTLTGVFYTDIDRDGFYTPGEGKSGVQVSIGDFSATSNDAGGYSIVLPQDFTGKHTVTVSGGGFAHPVKMNVNIDDKSVKLDMIDYTCPLKGLVAYSSDSQTAIVEGDRTQLVLLGVQDVPGYYDAIDA